MTVYVDDMMAKYGRMIMCHMIADTDEELHAMADIIGVARRWHQAPPRYSSHYDISLGARAKAVQASATEITVRQAATMNKRRQVTGSLGLPEEAALWRERYQEEKESRREVASSLGFSRAGFDASRR